MMRKKIVSLCMALALCLSLLPVTALAAAPNGQVIYVGNENVTNGGYWTTSEDGKTLTSVTSVTESNNYIHYDTDTNTLTLHNATIKVSVSTGTSTYVAGAAIGVHNHNGAAELTITLEGTNTIAEVGKGIYVLANSTGGATLTITGDGSLDASASQTGIWVHSNSNNAALCVENAEVTASADGAVKNGVLVQAKDGSDVSLTVNGGSLTASVNANIWFQFGSGLSGSGTPTVTVSNNAIVRANGGITDNSSSEIQIGADSSASSGGIVFDGKNGTVYGDVTLDESLTINQGETLTIPEGSSLTSNDKLTNNGTIVNTGGTLNGEPDGTGKIETTPTIDTQPENQTVTAGNTATFTVDANGENLSYQWQQKTTDSGSDWTNVGSATSSNTYTIDNTTTSMSGYQYRCVVNNSAGSVTSNAATLTVNAATVPVTGVKLDQTELSLYTGESKTLIATVQPSDATNKNVTWSSDKPEVATVENGKVTAKAAGTATITVTTEDGKKTATCTVTVTRPYIPPANPNYKITVEATQGGTVTADPTAAKAGTTVTLTPVPDRGYQVGTVAVTDRFGEPVAVTEQADGTYTFTMPNGQVTVTVTFAEAPLPFPDVTEGDWFYDAVRYAYETGLMDGVGDSLFAPNSETTRAQLVTILYRLAGEPEPGGDSGFSDVAAGTWYTDAVAWAAENGIVNGTTDTTFAPGDDITREQLAAILYRYAACQGYDVSQRADLSGFGDASSIRPYAQEALSWAHAQGLVLGFEDGSLRPQGTASRAQIAAVLMRFLAAVSAE